jgi:hypothetical protein
MAAVARAIVVSSGADSAWVASDGRQQNNSPAMSRVPEIIRLFREYWREKIKPFN